MAEKFDCEGNVILVKVSPTVSQPVGVPRPVPVHSPHKMADKLDSEGNFIPVKVSQPVGVPHPVLLQSPPSTPPVTSSDRKLPVTTNLFSDVCHVGPVITPEMNGFIQKVLKDTLRKERRKMQQKFDAKYHRLADELRDQVNCDSSALPVSGDHVPKVVLETGSAAAPAAIIKNDEAPKNCSVIASLATSCITMLAKHRSINVEQMVKYEAEHSSVLQNREEIIASQLATITDFQELLRHHHSMENVMENQVTTIYNLKQQLGKKEALEKEMLQAFEGKDRKLVSQVKEIKRLKTRLADVIHVDNIDHLSRQQQSTISFSSSSVCASDSSHSQSSVSSYKESASGSSHRQSKPASGQKQTRSVPRHRTRRSSQSSSASSYRQPRSVPSYSVADDRQAMEIKRRQQTEYISRIGSTVDTLAQRYSPPRYTHVSTKSNYPVVGGPSVLDVFPALCLFAGEEDPTAEELSKYDDYLASQLRPPPIYSPILRKPNVNWAKLNPFQHKNLPKPSLFPVLGCSDDPEFYKKTVPFQCGGGYHRKKLKWGSEEDIHPFGCNFSFVTNMGLVAIPTMPLHGYRCHPSIGEWVIDAIG